VNPVRGEGGGTDPRGQVTQLVAFLRDGLCGKALTKGWGAKAQALLGELGVPGDG
jgi:hypothetical protein